ncbi:Hsp70 family protein [Sphingobacterium thalpophilum]|uniref:Hsp70 family protein n=1 Tax=Sphingobacterium thalpophilum TaxID=259 RepID=A0ACD5C7R9_9SPHI
MKINYGIYIGTSSASIAKMDAGEVCVLKSDTLNDEIPLCVAINRKGNILVGQKAIAIYRMEVESQSLNTNNGFNSFIEFSRTLGTDKKYFSSNVNRSFLSEELLAEVIKCLISSDKSTIIQSAVITIPDAFKLNQIDALRKSASLAGLKQVEFIQESVAVGLAYNLDYIRNQGFNLVFYFDDEFKVSLLKGNNIIDSEDENYLGGKNLDLAVVDEIIIPHIKENFSIDDILNDDHKKLKYREALIFFAEELKNELSFKGEFNLYKEEGAGTDDEGEDIEIDLLATQSDLEKVLSPIFQKAIDISKKLLERNNLKASTINFLALIGKETFSPVLRKMLEQQICKPDTSVDPITAIVKGATIYASTIEISNRIANKISDFSKIQIEIGYEEYSVESEEFVTLKILADKSEGTIPKKVIAEITRTDKAWSSGNVEINEIGEVIEVQLIKGHTSRFEITLCDDKGQILECQPSAFQIERRIYTSPTLPYSIGTEVQDKRTGKIIFQTISGLEINKSLPVLGTYNGIKTDKPLRPGMDSDFIKIPLYQGEHGADGTRAIYNEHVYDIIISGADLPALLPENSDVDLTINIDKSQKVSIQAYFPYLDHTAEIEVPTDTVQSVETNWLANEIRKAKGSIEELKNEGINNEKIQKAETEIAELERKFENNKNDVDSKQEVLTNLRKTLKDIDALSETTEWRKIKVKLIYEFQTFKRIAIACNNDNLNNLVQSINEQLNQILVSQGVFLGKALLDEIEYQIERINSINEKYDREYFELYENGSLTLIDLKKALEKVNRTDGLVYREVLELIKCDITIKNTEDFLKTVAK